MTADALVPAALPPMSPFKAARFRRKLTKILGLKAGASQARIVDRIRSLEAIAAAKAPPLAKQLAMLADGHYTNERLLQLGASVKAVPAAVAEAPAPAVVALTEPLEAVRRRG